MKNRSRLLPYIFLSFIDYVRWQLKSNGLNQQEVVKHLIEHDHYEDHVMSTDIPTSGDRDDWRALLQETHRYIVHYSTVRLSLITFLVTACLTALIFSLPKETVKIDDAKILVYYGQFNLPAFSGSILFYFAAVGLNWVFDRRRYVMERYGRDVEIVLDTKIRKIRSPTSVLPPTPPTQTSEEHSLDQLSPDSVNNIIAHNNERLSRLKKLYAKDCRVYSLTEGPPLNRFITVVFGVFAVLLVVFGLYGYRTQGTSSVVVVKAGR